MAARPASDHGSPTPASDLDEHHGKANSASRSDQTPDPPNDSTVERPKNSSCVPRKRKRSRRDPDQKHECTAPGCGKTYSRAEHLYRHQLNHQPKEIFHCKYQDCQRTFVRQDLCARHEERHSVRGPAESSPVRQTFKNPHQAPLTRASHSNGLLESGIADSQWSAISFQTDQTTRKTIDASSQGQTIKSPPIAAMSAEHSRSNSFSMPPPSRNGLHARANSSNSAFSDTTPSNSRHLNGQTQSTAHLCAAAPSSRPPEAPEAPSPAWSDGSNRADTLQFAPQNNGNNNNNHMIDPSIGGLSQSTMAAQLTSASGAPLDLDLERWLYPDETTAWLFGNDQSFDQNPIMPPGFFSNTFDGISLSDVPDLSPTFLQDFGSLDENGQPIVSPQAHPMSLSNIVDFDSNLPESTVSEDKRRSLVDLIKQKFDETDTCPGNKQKHDFLGGDQTRTTHVLSLGMVQTYLAAYWSHFHPQVPILHKPTFDADRAPNLLLIAMMTLGASCLERIHGHEVTQACADLANFLAWHLRWALFKHTDFRPPAKLWMFQSLLLLEFYEKMYATTRTMHERAHIHHGTTLTLMRRGSFLTGQSAVDPDGEGEGMDSEEGKPVQMSRQHGSLASDAWWYAWSAKEATRRAVLAAFVMDTTHAIMFGHAAVMAVHEMRLPLPCDEDLWNNTSSAEVARLEAGLRSKGIKRPGFLDSLKQTLNGQKVVTNTFGRTVLMAGLLSVSWHMSQRDLQVTSLGVAPSLGGEEKWKTSLKRAFNFWKRDFDESLSSPDPSSHYFPDSYNNDASARHLTEDGNVFESRHVMHHLAHMSLHVDIVDAQIFAGSPTQLGRKVTASDRAAAERRIKEIWAPSARAREAYFNAVRFLSKVLVPEDFKTIQAQQQGIGGGPAASATPDGEMRPTTSHLNAAKRFDYSAREDDLLNRPWILFYAALVVWCYGYALDGPVSSGLNVSRLSKIHDMQQYLKRVGSVPTPEDLRSVRNRNKCVGLLMTLRDLFQDTRWQLLHEASYLFNNCIDMLLDDDSGG